jgi:hypothetical protein
MICDQVTGQIRDRPVVLVPVVAEMRENKVRLKLPQTLHTLFDRCPLVREITLPEPSEPDFGTFCIAEELARALLGFEPPRPVRAGNEPEGLNSRRRFYQLEKGSATPDFNVVGLCAKGPRKNNFTFCGWHPE